MENTDFAAALLRELEAEYASTKKCLERIPESAYDYKPHPTSMALGYLTLLVAEIPLWISYMIEKSEIDFVTFPHFEAKTTKELVDHFEENFQSAKKSLQNATNEDLEKTFSLKNDGKVLYSAPILQDLVTTINHWVHHRGQLTVYMRMKEIPVPSIYGPSADDKKF